MCYVLIVEPDEMSREIIKKEVRTHFVNVHLLPEALTGKKALEVAKEHEVEILILSLDLDDMDGFELMYQLLLQFPNLKTIITSETKDFDKAQHAIRCGVLDFLIKPLHETFVFALDRTIKSINQVSLYNDEKAKKIVDTNKPGADILKMVDYIHDNYQKDPSLSELASKMHLNEQYTSRVFKENLGMNFVTYLMEYRIEKAKKLLSTSTDSVGDIASSVGYLDATYFTKVFKKKTGYTPRQYRTLFKGERIIFTNQKSLSV